MKHNLLRIVVLFALLSVAFESKAQNASGIPFQFAASSPSVATGALTSINLTSRPAAIRDEFDTLIVLSGWSFNFAGTIYSNVIISTNGWLALAPAATVVLPPYFASPLPNNIFNTYSGGLPLIAPLWDNDSCALIQYSVVANVLTVKWTLKWDKSFTGAYSPLVWTTLNGNTGVIEFHYSTTGYTPGATASATIGIAGVCTGDFISVSPNAVLANTTSSNTTDNNSVNFKPVNVKYSFTPVNPSDACASAVFLGNINSVCTDTLVSTFNALPSGASNCSSGDDNDVWFTCYKPAGASSIKITTKPAGCGNASGTSLEVYDACGGTLLGCATNSAGGNPTFAEVSLTRSACAAETLFVRVTTDGDVPGKFNICTQDVTTTNGNTCANPASICLPVPFHANGMNTAGSGNDYNDSVLCQSDWMTGQDYVYVFAPTVTACYNIILDGAGANSYPGLFLFDGCPNDTDFSSCVATSQNISNGDSIMNVTLSGGHAYYVVIDNNALLAGTNSIPFNLHITTSASAAPINDACGSAASLGTIAFNQSCVWSPPFTTQCANPSPVGGYPNPVCGAFQPALTNDVWFTFQPTFSGTIQIMSQGTGTNPVTHGGLAVYTGTCGLLSLVGCAGDSVGIPFMPTLSIPVSNQVYYLRVWSATYQDPGTFQLCFQSNCSPANDLPINAITLPLATPTLGDNTCSTGAQEMANPINCPTGTVNTVWYKLIIPASGQVAVRISQLSLLDAAVAAFLLPTGPSNAPTSFSRLACNDDIIFAPPCPICGMTGDNDAAIQFTSTPGATAYIAVDGESGQVGSFYITAIEGNLASTFPPVYRKDCANPEFVCANNNYYLPNGGVGSDGNICDFTNLPCSGSASTSEVGSAWLQFTVSPGSSLGFTITPNDSSSPVANYNFYLWDITNVSNFCSQISTTTPVRCNTVAGTGKTGLRSPAAGPFSNTIGPFAAPHTYMLFIQNLTSANDDEGVPGTNTGFMLNWQIYSGGVPIGATALSGTSPNSTWTGTVIDTNYQYLPNWKGVGTCPAVLPTCTTDVFISAASKPCWVMGNSYAKNLTINPGATLRLLPGSNMHICGNYLNNGTLIADPGSTITFEGPGKQTISGVLTGASAFPSLVINKSPGTDTVKLMNNIDIKENFTTNNGSSIFSINNKYMKIAGHFTNAIGTLTFTTIPASTVEFYGTANQNFTNNSGSINLNRVFMNKTSGKVYLTGASSTMNIDSVLNMTSGNIVTPQTLEVNIKWGSQNAIINHTANSFIDGRLRRKLFIGSIDWPLGDSLVPNQGVSKGYELANTTFTSSTVITDLLAWFSTWPAGVVPNGPATFDYCGTYTTQYNQQIFDNGFWTFQRSVTFFNGTYNVTLYNTGGTNTGSGVAWSVGTAGINSNPMVAASWNLLGTCDATSTATVTRRNGFNNPVGPGGTTSFNHLYATVQSAVVLPVELIYFTAEPKGEHVVCKWETASETDNDYFEVERSPDGKEFTRIGDRIKGYGAGLTSEKRSYELIDEEICEQIRYYRLKQVDINGQFSYSETIAVNCSGDKGVVKVYPNPANTTLFSSFFEAKNGMTMLQWQDMMGKIVKVEMHEVVKFYNTIQSDISDLPKGVYYLRVNNSDNDSVNERRIKFIKN